MDVLGLRRLWRGIGRAAARAFDRPGVILSFGIGLAFGVTLHIPLIPWMLSDGASSVFGAAAGALIGAGGAGLIAVRITTLAERKARDDVQRTVRASRSAALVLQSAFAGQNLRVKAAIGSLRQCERTLRVARDHLDLYKSSDRYIQAAGIAIVEANVQVDGLLERVTVEREALNDQDLRDPHGLYGMGRPLAHALDNFLILMDKIQEILL